jgi:hypothetical protein
MLTPRRSLLALALVVGAVTAPAVVASPAAAATIGLAIGVDSDGAGSFTPADGPGADSGPTNGVVRTFDSVTYRVEVSSNDGPSTNETFQVRRPAGTTWAGVPNACTGAGSGIEDDVLTCNVGPLSEGETRATPVVLRVGGGLANGTPLAITGTVTADGSTEPGPTMSSPTTTVSAAPRYDLSKNVVTSQLTAGVTGPDGVTEGIAIRYPIAVSWDPVVPGQGMLGFERSTGTFSFEDDVSGMAGGTRSQAQLLDLGGVPACGQNARGIIGQMPGGSGGGSQAVLDSGSITCTQDGGPGSPIRVVASGVDTAITPSTLPDRTLEGGSIPGGTKPYVISGYITLWVPKPAPDSTFVAVNRYRELQTESISGLANAAEPMADNVAERNLSEFLPGTGYKSLVQVTDRDADTVANGSAKKGDPYVTAGQLLRAHVSTTNPGTGAYRDAVLCDVLDNRYQHVSRRNARGTAAYTSGISGTRVEYAAFGFTDPAVGRDATCGDDDGPWYSDPDDVPGGADAVGKVRAVGTVDGGRTANLFVYLDVVAAPNGTRVQDFGQVNHGTTSDGAWVHDQTDPSVGAGPYADSVIVTESMARVTKKIVDPGTDEDTTPDDTAFVVSGNSLDFAVYPTLSNATGTGRAQDVTVVDTLPAHSEYEDGSASIEPVDRKWVTDEDGQRRQRLTWVLPGVVPGSMIEAIRYTVDVDRTAPPGSIQNSVAVRAPDDVSAERFRQAFRAVQVVASGGVGVAKTAREPVVVNGDLLRWTLEYTNTNAAPIQGVDLIDVLPYDGDDGGSRFAGTARLASGVTTASGELATYTSARPQDIDVDAGHASNRPGGTTTWCAAADFGSGACPRSFADVTGVRLLRTTGVAVGERVQHEVALTTHGAEDGDVYTNRFGLRASNLDLAVQSNRASVTVVSGTIGDVVWEDRDGDGLQDHDEPGAAGVAVTLTGRDDRGIAVDRSTTTDADGHYRFSGLRPGSYRVHVALPPGTAATRQHVGDDRTIDSDIAADGVTPPVTLTVGRSAEGTLEGVSSDLTVDAGLVSDPCAVDEPGDAVSPGQGADDSNTGGSDSDRGSGPADHRPAGGTSGATGTSGVLAFTGAEVLPLLLGAGALVALGACTAVVARRRRSGDRP